MSEGAVFYKAFSTRLQSSNKVFDPLQSEKNTPE